MVERLNPCRIERLQGTTGYLAEPTRVVGLEIILQKVDQTFKTGLQTPLLLSQRIWERNQGPEAKFLYGI